MLALLVLEALPGMSRAAKVVATKPPFWLRAESPLVPRYSWSWAEKPLSPGLCCYRHQCAICIIITFTIY